MDLYARTGVLVEVVTEVRFTEFEYQPCWISVERLGHAGSQTYHVPTVTFKVQDLMRYHSQTWDVRNEIPTKEEIIKNFREALTR